jgi:hypothetical protein
VAAAIKALSDPNSDCQFLFAQTPGAPKPLDVLNTMLASLQINPISAPAGQVTSTTTTASGKGVPVSIGNDATQATYASAVVTPNDVAGAFMTGTTTDQAATLLHELGHVYSDLYGSASTAITNDGPVYPVSVSEANQKLVIDQCFH